MLIATANVRESIMDNVDADLMSLIGYALFCGAAIWLICAFY